MSSSPSRGHQSHQAFFVLKTGKNLYVVKSDSSDALEASATGNNALLFQMPSASEDSNDLVLLQTLGGRMQVAADPSLGIRLQDSSKAQEVPFLKVPAGGGFALGTPDKKQWLSVSDKGKLGFRKMKSPGASETFTTEILASAYRHDCCGPSLDINAKWNDLGHSSIVETAINCLRKQSADTPEAKLFIEMLDSDGSLQQKLMEGLHDADYEDALRDKQGGIPYWSSHFYDPDNGQNYWKDGSPTALERGRDFFKASLRVLQVEGGDLNFKIGRRSGGGSLHFGVKGAMRRDIAQASFKMLGIALHYFTDLSQPMHASNVANIYGKDVRYPQPTDFRHSGFEEQGDDKVEELFQNYAPLTPQQMDVYNINNVEQLYEDIARASKNVWLSDVQHLFDEKLVLPPPPPAPPEGGPEPIQLPVSLPWGDEETQPALEHSLKLAPIRVAQFLLYWTHLAMKRSWLDWAKYDGKSSPACGVNKGGQIFSLSKPNAAGETVLRFLSEPKFARDIAVGSDGTVWAVSNKKLPGGYAIYYLADGTKNRWVEIKPPVSATKIAVRHDGTAVVINEGGTVWAIKRPNADGVAVGEQLSEAGYAQEISVGRNNSIWAISKKERKGGFAICYLAKGKPWVELQAPAAAVKVAAARNGSAWVINKGGAVFSLSKPDATGKYVGKEHPEAGSVQEISVGSDGSVWTISYEQRTRGFAPYYLPGGIFRKKKWVQLKGPASATKVAAL